MTTPLEDILPGDGGAVPGAGLPNADLSQPEVGSFQQEQPQQHPEQGAQPPEGYVPIQALDAAREKSRAREQELEDVRRQLAAFTAPPQPQPQQPKRPEFWEDPQGYLAVRDQEAAQQQRLMREQTSLIIAEQAHGRDVIQKVVSELDAEMKRDPQLNAAVHARIYQIAHPYDELVKIHRERSALQTYGADPEAYIKAEVERRIQEAQGIQQPPVPQQQPAKPAMPSSFAAASSAGPRSAQQWTGPKPISEITKGSRD